MTQVESMKRDSMKSNKKKRVQEEYYGIKKKKKSIPGSLRVRWRQNVLSVEKQNDSKIDDRVEII